MKKSFLIILIALLLAGCTTRTEYGACVGINDEKNPALIYKVDILNAFLGILFVQTIIVPLVVVIDVLYCPVARKTEKEPV